MATAFGAMRCAYCALRGLRVASMQRSEMRGKLLSHVADSWIAPRRIQASP
jgi:hypothetical protein